MNTTHKKAVILDYLIPLHISYLNQAIGLKRIGSRNKAINLHSVNPITGKNEVIAYISISVNIDTGSGNDYANLQYLVNDKQGKQRIELTAKKAPIGKGNVYYFRCPVTGKLRRKLFLYNGRFVSKLAIPNPHYLSQIQSHKERNSMKDMKKLVRLQNIVKQGRKRYFKRFYDGNFTRKYMKILDAEESLNASW